MKDPVARRRVFMHARIAMLATLLCLGAAAVVHRAWDLQVRRAAMLKEMAEEQYLRDVNLAPKRGTIYDRDGAELAVSVDVDSVWANPRALRRAGHEPRAVAQRVAALLDVDAEVIAQRLASNRHFVWIKRRVSPAQGKAIGSLGVTGLSTSGEARRFYPNRELAAHVLGFANIDGRGIEGMELALDERLRGPAHAIPALLDRRGEVVFSERLLDDRAALGDDVTLTLDKTLQHLAERELELAVKTHEAHAGTIVIMEPSTGELYAVANYPTFNPNEPAKAANANHRNRAFTDRFEPGSTIKPFTVGGALAAQAISPAQLIDCEGGALKVAEYTIHDSHAWELLSPAQILAMSSNIGTAKVGLALGRAGLYRALTRFGFGQSTQAGLPGETSGILRHYKRWYEMDAATISFGQGMSTTAMQLTAAMGTLANKGRLMQPTVVKRIVDSSGKIVQEAVPRVRRQVVPESVARSITQMLIGVTAPGGTAPEAAIDGYLVAGKTGTAQKADYVHGGYADDKWTSSFVGYAPAQRPRLVVTVVLDEPMIAHQGGTVAAPVFRRVMGAALRHLGVRQEAAGSLAAWIKGEKAQPASAPGKSDELASAGAAAAPAPEPVLAEGELLVPDLIGRGARAAVVLARSADFDVRLVGSGVVTGQEPAARAVVPRGTRLTLQLTAPADHTPLPPSAAGVAPGSSTVQLVARAAEAGQDG
jgi:cell division protein FtsI (penicillin-binding protein 3)